MTSLRHNVENGPHGVGEGALDPRALDPRALDPQSSYLDAARACILDVGWRRTTLTEVARRAGVSRMTIYRAWPDMPAVLGDLMTREWGQVVALAVAEADARLGRQASAADRLVAEVVATTRALRENELFVRIVELDAELLLPYLLTRRGRSQQAIADLTASRIHEGQADGSIRDGQPVAMSRALLLAAHGFVLSAHTMVDDDVDEADLDAELEHLVRRTVEG
jgi:AcrR family transcriptional regulator